MGLQVILHIQSQDNVVFDIAGMNAHFMTPNQWGGFNELYGEFAIGDKAFHTNDIYQGPFIDVGGEIQIANREEDYFADYSDHTEVWGCFDDGVAQDISTFCQSGRLVFRLEIEGNETKYFIIEPNKMTMKTQSQLTI